MCAPPRDLLLARLGRTDAEGLFVPGRIEVLGKHTDYCGGRSLLCAVERGIELAWVPRDDSILSIEDAVLNDRVELPTTDLATAVQGHWSNYPATVVRRLANNFGRSLRGADVVLASDLPQAAGLSSSSAVVTAFTLILARINGLARTSKWQSSVRSQEDLATYLGAIESGRPFRDLPGDRGVGTLGGSEDHAAILGCRPDTLSQYAFFPVRREREIPLPHDYTFVIASSGVVAEKTGAAMAKYNDVALRAAAILELWNAATGRSDACLAHALDADPAAIDRLRTLLRDAADRQFSRDDLTSRLDQHLAESREIIPAAGAALLRADLPAFGRLVTRSQELAERLLGNQVPQTVLLASSASELNAVAASAFGAGFGGAVWALVRRDAAPEFVARWRDRYLDRFPDCASRSVFFTTRAGPSACWRFGDRREAIDVSNL